MGLLERFCRKCKYYYVYDENFGYCNRYKCQARHDDTCSVIKEMIGDV